MIIPVQFGGKYVCCLIIAASGPGHTDAINGQDDDVEDEISVVYFIFLD